MNTIDFNKSEELGQLKDIAVRIARDFVNHPGLIGIIWIGSSSFGIFDGYTDIDLRLVVKQDTKRFPMKQLKINGIKIEIDEMSWDWIMQSTGIANERFWIRDKGIILYDPRGQVKNSFRRLNRKIRRQITAELWQTYKEIVIDYEIEKAIKRKMEFTANSLIYKVIDSLARFLFIYHGSAVPPQKWQWYFLKKQKLASSSFIKDIEKLANHSVSLISRYRTLLKIKSVVQKLMIDKGYSRVKVLEFWRY